MVLLNSVDYTRCPKLWRNLPPLNMADLDMTLRRDDDVGSICKEEIEFILDLGYEAGAMSTS